MSTFMFVLRQTEGTFFFFKHHQNLFVKMPRLKKKTKNQQCWTSEPEMSMTLALNHPAERSLKAYHKWWKIFPLLLAVLPYINNKSRKYILTLNSIFVLASYKCTWLKWQRCTNPTLCLTLRYRSAIPVLLRWDGGQSGRNPGSSKAIHPNKGPSLNQGQTPPVASYGTCMSIFTQRSTHTYTYIIHSHTSNHITQIHTPYTQTHLCYTLKHTSSI